MSSWHRGRIHTALRRGFFVCSMLLVSCAGPQEVEEIRLGLIVQQDTSDGPSTVRTVKLAVDAFNEAGGLLVDGERRPVVLLIEDPEGRPEAAARAALRMVNQQGVFALIGPSRSVNAVPVSEVANNARIPMISPASTNVTTTAGKPYVFRVTYTDPVQGSGMARFARDALSTSTAAVLYDETVAYSRELAHAFRSSFEHSGGEIVAFSGFVRDGWRDALDGIGELRPDVLFLPNFEEFLVPQVQRAKALGMEATLLGGDSWPVATLSPMPELDGSFLAVPWHSSVGPGSRSAGDLFAAYERTWGEPLTYVTPVLAYDAAGMMLKALKQAGRPDSEAVRQALADLSEYPGITGSITFRGTEGDPAKLGVVIGLRDGRAHFIQRLPAGDPGRAQP